MDADYAAGEGAVKGVAGLENTMNIKFDITKLKIEELCYYAFFILLSVAKGLGFFEGQKLFVLLVTPAILCGFLKLILTSYTRSQRVIVFVLFLLTLLVYYESAEVGILFVMFTILGMKDIPLDKIFRIGLWAWTLCVIVLSTVQFFRIEHTVYRVVNKLGLGYIMRWSLGFTHPNTFHITYLALCGFIIYKLADRYRFRHFALMMLGNMLVFFYSVSYTGLGIVTLLLIGELYVVFRHRFCILEKIAVNLVLPSIILFSFVLPFVFFRVPQYTDAVQKLNLLVNTRIYVASTYLVSECISPFGVRMSYLSQIQSYLSIDNSYMWAFIHYGIIPFVLLMSAYFVLIFDYSRKQKTRELVLIICFLCAGLTEPLLFNASFKNVTLLFLGELLFRQKAEAEEHYLIPVLNQKVEAVFHGLITRLPKQVWFFAELPAWFGAAWKSYRKQILAGIAAGALIGAILCGICYNVPKGYVVPRKNTDWVEKDFLYLESSEDPAYEGYRIMNYQDADTLMQVVEGNAVILETVRYYVGSILIGGLAGYLIGAGMMVIIAHQRTTV